MKINAATPATLVSLAADWLGKSADYRPSAFWFWNSGMEQGRMREMVAGMAKAGIREFLIHPTHGMEIEYLSPTFFDRYRLALNLANEQGMKVWVYDEYAWPSGVAGGLLLRHHPEHRGWCMEFTRDASGKVIAEPHQSDRILDAVVGAPWTQSERGYVDTLSKPAMRCFIEMTHERILQECGELFQQTIVGFFTDEPTTMFDRFNGTQGGWATVGLPWTPELPKRFKLRFGYDIEHRYAELAGNGPSQMKRDYWNLVKELHVEAYHGQMGQWCREHGVKYTGHVGEDALMMQVRFTGSLYQSLSQMDEPGIDYLGGSEPEDRFIEQVAVPSIARHSGKSRVYCEAHGVSPLDLRLGEMLRRAQMFGIHGINDIALMGFQQNLDGLRKRTYWPPYFNEAPWWPFYSPYRDAMARSISLSSLGSRHARYAILYPQDCLEQMDVLTAANWDNHGDVATATLRKLGLAIYAAGETFEFVFPEILSQAQVKNGKIHFPHAQYDALIVPQEFVLFADQTPVFDSLANAGGIVMKGTAEQLEQQLCQTAASWADQMKLQCDGTPGDIRVYRFDYPDGDLFALRNVTDQPRTATVRSDLALATWDPVLGTVTACDNLAQYRLNAHSTCYFTLSQKSPATTPAIASTGSLLAIDADWRVTTLKPNMARLSQMQFRDSAGHWHDAVVDPWLYSGKTPRCANGLPAPLRNATQMDMQATFHCASLPQSLGVLFEPDHLLSLSVNGKTIDLSTSVELPVWDPTCRCVDIKSLIMEGENQVTAQLAYQAFETSTFTHGWLPPDGLMPMCDLVLAGPFRLDGDVIRSHSETQTNSLPLDLRQSGWAEYHGILSLTTTLSLDQQAAQRVDGLALELFAEDAVEVLLDGKLLTQRVTAPYHFPIANLTPGTHTLNIRISGTSANLLGGGSDWGLRRAQWILKP